MQFKAFLSILSIAAMATAGPLTARTGKTCEINQKAKCCELNQLQLLGILPINLGLNCIDVALVDLGSCRNTAVCCESGTQTGLVNLGNVCFAV